MSRLSRIIALAALPTAPSDILLKVCPTCKMAHSKYDDYCSRCSKKANEISKLKEIQGKKAAGEKLTEHEEKQLAYLPEKIQWFLDNIVRLPEQEFLSHAPFTLPKDLIGVSPSFTNRLTFFMDRMKEQGKNVVSTKAATKLLNSVYKLFGEKKTDKKDIIKDVMSNRDFVNFAFKYKVKPLMSADSEYLYAAWNADDIVELYRKFQSEMATKSITVEKGEENISSAEAATIVGATTPKTFTDFAYALGIIPVQSLGDNPEQKAWHKDDVFALRSVWGIESEIREMESAIERAAQTIEQTEKDIEKLNEKPMKWQEMQEFRNKKELLSKKQAEIAALHNGIKVLLVQREQKVAKIREMADKRKAEKETPKEASNKRLMRILALA